MASKLPRPTNQSVPAQTMRHREVQIPILLWIATAVLVHLLGGGSTHGVAVFLEERRELRAFAARIQREVKASVRPIEIVLAPAPPAPEANQPEQEAKEPEPKPEKPKERKKPQVADKKPLDEPPKELVPPVPPKPQLVPVVPAPTPPPKPEKPAPELKLEPQRRIAVRQHVEDPNQPDNPDAKYIADQANRVKEEKVAKITSTDKDDQNPTPGTPHQGKNPEPGNADETKVLGADGELDRGEDKPPPPELALMPNQESKPPAAPAPTEAPKPTSSERIAQTEPPAQTPEKAEKEQKASEPLLSGEGETWQRQAARERVEGRAERAAPKDRTRLGNLPLTPGGINLNLTRSEALAVVGPEQLQKDIRADKLRRRARHVGSWKFTGLDRWRAAIENYVPGVKPGNQTALNTARVPFASYLNQIHNRLHPIFADTFLSALDRLPADNPLNRPDLHTFLEIVVSRTDGSLVRMGVTRASGVTAFDINALEAVQQASPFGPPPSMIVSPDGNVYLHWEFHRDPNLACSTYFARPFILKGEPRPSVPPLENPEPTPFQEPGPRLRPTGFGPLRETAQPSNPRSL